MSRRKNVLSRREGPPWSRAWGWSLLAVALSCLAMGIVSLLLAVGSYPLSMCIGYWKSPLLLLLNLLPVLALGLLFYGITGRAPWAFGLTGLVVLGLSSGNYWKIAFRDDPLMLGDLLLLREAGTMAQEYRPWLDKTMALTVLFFVLTLLALCLLARGRPKKRARLGLALGSAALLVALIPISLSTSLYERTANYDYLEDRWSASQQYMAHGFLYPFLHSATTTLELPPEGYNRREAQAQLSAYSDADIPADQRVNLVCVMLESYNDFTKFGAPELAADIYAPWHQLEREGCAGNLVTNIFGAGTVDTERCFLTGDSSMRDIRGNINAYPWYFQRQGYTTAGLHPSPQWFYNRQNVNRYLGFERYDFMENRFSQLTDWPTAGDDIFFAELLRQYRQATASTTPYFNFSVTYQGHGPYAGDVFYWGDPGDYVVDDGSYTSEEYLTLCNYFASVADTNQHLQTFTDALRDDPSPVVLVLFGDHNPSFDASNALYAHLGIDLSQDTATGFFNYYATRYIIWANDAAKAVLGREFQGQGPDISPCFLMNLVFSLCGWDGPAYMQAIAPTAAEIPVIHTAGWYLTDGSLTRDLPPDKLALVRSYQNLQYYWRTHFAYRKD